MKMLTIKQAQSKFQIYDDDVCIYTLTKDEESFCIKNAYDRKVALLKPQKESFSLFQDKKKIAFELIFETRAAGTWMDRKHTLTLEGNDGNYVFYSGRMLGKDMLIGYEADDFVFQIDHYDDHAVMFLKQPEYAVYAGLYYAYFIFNGKQYSDSEDFLSHLPEDMMSFV